MADQFEVIEVIYVCYAFRGSDLIPAEQEEKYYDLPLCVERYRESCLEVLRKAYDTAERVEVINTDEEGWATTQVLGRQMTSRSGLRGQLIDSGDISEGTRRADIGPTDAWASSGSETAGHEVELLAEIRTVEDLCNAIYNEFRWEVPRPWLTILEAYDRFSVPIGLISWACRQGLVEEADRDQGIWKFPQECFIDTKLIEVVEQSECLGVLGIPITDSLPYSFRCYPNDAPIGLEQLGQVSLAIPPEWIHVGLFNSGNSSFLVSRSDDELLALIERFHEQRSWFLRWSFGAYSRAFSNAVINYSGEACAVTVMSEDECIGIELRWSQDDPENLTDLVVEVETTLDQIISQTNLLLAGGPVWREGFETNEDAFCLEFLQPLLIKMGFAEVRYTCGNDEYGKDFVCLEYTKSGEKRYIGVQAKKGDIRGTANAQVEKIINQVQTALEMPYEEIGQPEIYLSEVVVAASGLITRQARNKIRRKLMRLTSVGSVYFWDRIILQSLARRYWADELRTSTH